MAGKVRWFEVEVVSVFAGPDAAHSYAQAFSPDGTYVQVVGIGREVRVGQKLRVSVAPADGGLRIAPGTGDEDAGEDLKW